MIYQREISPLWWDEDDKGQAALAVAQTIEQSSSEVTRQKNNLMKAKLYCNRELSSIYECGISDSYTAQGVYLTLNVVQSCADTVTSKIARSKPRPEFLTVRGDWQQRREARDLTDWVDGVYFQNDAFTEAQRAFLDATIFDFGVLYAYGDEHEERVCLERVLPTEIFFDPTEALCGLRYLRTLFRKRYVHRKLLADRFARNANQKAFVLNDAACSAPTGQYSVNGQDMIAVYEAWHLPTSKKSRDGVHVLAIDGLTIYSEEWKRPRFPFAFYTWGTPIVGVSGRALAEDLIPIQLRINDLIDLISEGQRAMCIPRIFYQKNTINIDAITDVVGSFVPVDLPPGQAIQFVTPPGVSPEIYQELETTYKRAYEITGVSALSANAEVPLGIKSAVAFRELLDREDMRFGPKSQMWERLMGSDVPRIILDAAIDLAERVPGLSVKVPGNKYLTEIDWRSVSKHVDSMVIRPYPASSLPTTPAAKREKAREDLQDGVIDKPTYIRLLDIPDTGAEVSLISSTLEFCDHALWKITEKGEYVSPIEYADPVICRARAVSATANAYVDGAPDDVLDNLAQFIDECTELIELAKAKNPAPAPAAPETPAPLEPPVSTEATPAGTMVAPTPPLPPG